MSNIKNEKSDEEKKLDIIMAELHIIEQKKNSIIQKIDSLMSEKKMENVRKKLFNNKS